MSPAPSINPLLRGSGTYPFQRLTEARRVLTAASPDLQVLDFGAGEPREPTPDLIRRAMIGAIEQETVSSYPLAAGLPELRAAIAGWIGRRYGTAVDPDRHVLPTLGSKAKTRSLRSIGWGIPPAPDERFSRSVFLFRPPVALSIW